MTYILVFVAGFYFGIFVMALMNVASSADEQAERMEREQ